MFIWNHKKLPRSRPLLLTLPPMCQPTEITNSGSHSMIRHPGLVDLTPLGWRRHVEDGWLSRECWYIRLGMSCQGLHLICTSIWEHKQKNKLYPNKQEHKSYNYSIYYPRAWLTCIERKLCCGWLHGQCSGLHWCRSGVLWASQST